MKSPINAARLVLAVALVACSLVSGCDRKIYTDDELNIQDRFRAIKVGSAEQDVRHALGAPSSVVVRAGSDDLVVEVTDGGETRRAQISTNDRSNWPSELQFLADRPITGKVLVYIDGTVTAYYFLNPEGRLEYVDLFTS
jgi:hypothetical protein